MYSCLKNLAHQARYLSTSDPICPSAFWIVFVWDMHMEQRFFRAHKTGLRSLALRQHLTSSARPDIPHLIPLQNGSSPFSKAPVLIHNQPGSMSFLNILQCLPSTARSWTFSYALFSSCEFHIWRYPTALWTVKFRSELFMISVPEPWGPTHSL